MTAAQIRGYVLNRWRKRCVQVYNRDRTHPVVVMDFRATFLDVGPSSVRNDRGDMIRFCAVAGLAACLATIAVVPQLASGATSPVPDDRIDNPIARRAMELTPALERPSRPITRDRPVSANPLWAVPLSALSATRERPIFSPSRRPPAPPAVAVVSAPAPPPPKPVEPDRPLFTLVGTIVGGHGGIGVFLDQARNVVRLKTGQDHDGWTLRAVHGREATFDKDQRTATLSLPAPGTERPPQAALPVGVPTGGTWMDGDGQMIAPPKKAAQTTATPRATSGDPQ
jgi:general secretion pathway protein N